MGSVDSEKTANVGYTAKMAKYFLHRLDGRILGPIPTGQLLTLCDEARAFSDESIAVESAPDVLRPLSAVPRLSPHLAAGALARQSRTPMTVPVVAAQLRRAVVQIRTPTGSGSGFAIDDEGTIVTNRHVVEDSSSCTVTFDSGAISPGVVLYRSPHADFAVVRVALPSPDFICLAERRGDDVAVGEQSIALGFPQDAGFNVTQGIVGALQVRISPKESEELSRHEWVRTSAEINGGNSGGPVVSLYGDVVGMASWSQVRDSGGTRVTGMNYCIPHGVLCREVREYRRAIAQGTIRVPDAIEIMRGAHQPDQWEELDLAVSLACSRHRMRVLKKVPVPGHGYAFHHVALATEIGDRIDIHVDGSIFDGPPYVTVTCDIGEMPASARRDPRALEHLLNVNGKLPHWSFALLNDRLVLRFSRQLQLLDAVEILNALEDLTFVLDRLVSDD